MITHIKGRLSEKSPTNVVIETNGIGYWVNISLTTFSQIPDQESIKLYTHLQIKEDSHSLYGCLLYTSPSPRDLSTSRMPSSA